MELRAEAVETVRATAAPAKKTPAATKKTEPTVEAAPANETAGASDGPFTDEVVEELRGLVAKFVSTTDREEERAARKDKLKKLLRHEQVCRPEKISNTTDFDVRDIKDESIGLFRDNMVGLLAQVAKADLVPLAEAAGTNLDI
jgi:hypothetical protein